MVSSHSLDDDDGGGDDEKNTEDWLQSPGECPRIHTVFLAAGAGPHGPPPDHHPPLAHRRPPLLVSSCSQFIHFYFLSFLIITSLLPCGLFLTLIHLLSFFPVC